MLRLFRFLFVYLEASGLQADLFSMVGKCFPYEGCLDYLMVEIQYDIPHPKSMHKLYDHVIAGGNPHDCAKLLRYEHTSPVGY